MVAAVGAVSGMAVSVFLSMNALTYFRKGASSAAPSEGAFGVLLEEKGAPDFKQLFQQAVELGEAELHPCSMAIDLLDLGPGDLESYLGEPLGLTKFLDESRGAQVYTF
ncbi:MAG: DsrE/DsrF/DrsH-like family protein [Hyphomicrobiaceae bacterium]|nr:DsrE/DsrF/DrsH-like family protein [Hyphomicrobiaceae bacterium]